jgi:hypothetical protein
MTAAADSTRRRARRVRTAPERRTASPATPDTSERAGVSLAVPVATATARSTSTRRPRSTGGASTRDATTAAHETTATRDETTARGADTTTTRDETIAAADETRAPADATTAPTAAAGGADEAAGLTLAALKPDPRNRRKHPQRNLALIADALQHVGAARSIVIDETNEVLAGNGVVEAARSRGMTKLQVVDVDGDTIVAVRRRGLSVAQKRELAMYDNRTGELAEWNADQLDIDFKAGLNFAPFFTDQELAKLLPDNDAAQPTSVANPEPQYIIIVTCTDEVQQTDVLEQLLKDGLDCRAVVS